MGSKPFPSVIRREEFNNRIDGRDIIKHNVHQIDLWLNGSINDAQLNSNIKIDAKEILPTDPWPRPTKRV